jgi:hypothetical protein
MAALLARVGLFLAVALALLLTVALAGLWLVLTGLWLALRVLLWVLLDLATGLALILVFTILAPARALRFGWRGRLLLARPADCGDRGRATHGAFAQSASGRGSAGRVDGGEPPAARGAATGASLYGPGQRA